MIFAQTLTGQRIANEVACWWTVSLQTSNNLAVVEGPSLAEFGGSYVYWLCSHAVSE